MSLSQVLIQVAVANFQLIFSKYLAGDVLVRLLIPCECVILTTFHFAKHGVDMFGKRVGFLKFKADVVDKETGQKVKWLFLEERWLFSKEQRTREFFPFHAYIAKQEWIVLHLA